MASEITKLGATIELLAAEGTFHRSVLTSLSEEGSKTKAELCQLLDEVSSTVELAVHQLDYFGLVRRRKFGERYYVEITPKGVEALKYARP